MPLLLLASRIWMSDSTIEGCRAQGGTRVTGAGFALLYDSIVTLTRMKFLRCIAEAPYADGGAIYAVGSSRVTMQNATLASCNVKATSNARGALAFVEDATFAKLQNLSVVDCSASSHLFAQGIIYATDSGSTVVLDDSVVSGCKADEGGVVYTAQGSTAVLASLVVSRTEARRGAAVFMADGSRLQATNLRIHHTCVDGASSSVLRLAGGIGQNDPRIPVRGLHIDTYGCASLAPLIEADSEGVITPRCAEGTYSDVLR